MTNQYDPRGTDAEDQRAYVLRRQELCRELKELVVEATQLSIDPGWITDDQPIFGRGLELDSVESLELILAIEFEYGAVIEDDAVGAFASINALADFVERTRTVGS